MTAALYNTGRLYGAVELKRLAGTHAFVGLFLSVGIIGAVFLVLFLVSSATSSVVVRPIGPTVIDWGGYTPDAPQDVVPRGPTDDSRAATGGNTGAGEARIAPVLSAEGRPVAIDDRQMPPVEFGSPEFAVGTDPIDGIVLGGGSGSDAVADGGPGTNPDGTSVLGGGDDDEIWVQMPDVMPTVDQADLRSKVVYPPLAVRRGIEGRVVVAVLIDAQGRAAASSILFSSNEIFNDAALRAVSRAVFTPALRGGKPVSFRLNVPIEFQMK